MFVTTIDQKGYFEEKELRSSKNFRNSFPIERIELLNARASNIRVLILMSDKTSSFPHTFQTKLILAI